MEHQHLEATCRAFFPAAELRTAEEIKVGHINKTYRVTLAMDAVEGDYLLQSVNTYVFKEPKLVMENIQQVCAQLSAKEPQGLQLRFCKTPTGENFVENNWGFWRLCNYIPSVSYSSGADHAIVKEAALAFGRFQQQLSDFDAAALHETIPHFHDTIRRYEALEAAAAADEAGLLHRAENELSALLSLKEQACKLTVLYNEGKLPLRVTHNDTKINNVLFDKATGKALCVIDLDTVMPGLMGHDFGDAIRTAANTAAEDCADLSTVTVDLGIFRAFAEGYLSVLGDSLTELERDTLALSALVLTAEQAVRFLTDYLQGSVYFHIDYPEHNLIRTRCQLKLAQEIQSKLPEMEKIVAEICKR